MAVSVNEHNVVGAQQRLADNLVRRGRAVGHKVCVVRKEGARGLSVCILERSLRVQERIETAWGRKGFDQIR